MHSRSEGLAHTISRIGHPLSFICLTLFIINWHAQHSLLHGLIDTGVLLLCLLPSTVYLLATRRTRPPARKAIAITLLLLGVALTAGIYAMKGSSDVQIKSLGIGILGALGITSIHRRWNMSFHAATAMGCVALLLPISVPIAGVIGILAIITGLARLPLEEHTLLQVIAGWAYGFGVTIVLLALTS